MDGRYVTHIHHVSHLRNMRETSRIIANPRIISESCETPRNIAKHARNMRETCVIPCVNLAKHRETCAKHVRNVAVTYRPSIGILKMSPPL